MISRSERPEREAHHPQTHPYSCQAACMAMALARRGNTGPSAIEQRLHGVHPGSHPINEVGRSEPGCLWVKCNDVGAGLLKEFRRSLAERAWLVVHVSGPRWIARLPSDVIGPHGKLCPAGDFGQPFHSVLLVAAGPSSFFALDPFWSKDGQPFEVPDDDLLFALTGFSTVVIEP